MARTINQAELERVIRSFDVESTLRSETREWSLDHFDKALDSLDHSPTHGSDWDRRHPKVHEIIRRLRAECADALARAAGEAANEVRHDALLSRIEQLKRPHWSVIPNFWMTAIILLLTAVGATAAVWSLVRQ